jgi:hypothetical protein
LDYFLKHPIGLVIGFAKAYRDFFWFGGRGIAPFSRSGWQSPLNIILWLGMLTLLFRAIIQLFKGIRSDLDSLLLAGFIGIFLSIPFLPPIDGGSRFHAGTMPFFYAALVAGLGGVSWGGQEQIKKDDRLSGNLVFSRFASILLLVVVLILPIVLYEFGRRPAYVVVDCLSNEQPFIIEYPPGSYVDLIKENSVQADSIPGVSLDDFQNNNTELAIDDYYQKLVALARSDSANIRLIPAVDLIGNEFHYFYIPLDKLPRDGSPNLVAGCGIEIRTRNQSIFQVKSVFSNP